MGNTIVSSRMKSRREQLGLTLDDIASEIGVAKSTIQRYEKGTIERLKLPVIEAIAGVLNVNPSWLIGKTDDPEIHIASFPDNVIPMPRFGSIPLLGTIACGEPILAQENVEGTVDIPEHIHADFALRCKGDSMINARIYDGDIVYIRQQPTVDDGQIAAVLIGDEATLKRVHLFPDHVVLEPENPQFRPLVYWENDMNSVRILGLAVAFTSTVKQEGWQMKKLFRIFLILCLVVAVSNYLSTRAYENSFKGKSPIGIDGAPQATEPRYTVVNRCAAKFKSTFPDQSYTTYDTETNKFSLCFFDYNAALVADRLLGDNVSYLESWSSVRTFVSSLSSDFQKMCDDAGYSDIDVVVYVLYPDDVNAYYLSASHGHVVFDAIENYMFKNNPDDFVGFDLEASE